jgi:hypothetical protein
MNSTTATTSTRFAERPRAARRASRAASRQVVWAEIVALVLITVALIAALVVTSGRTHAKVPSERTRVENGQTLWTLASEHPVSGLTTEQTAELIASVNHIEGGQVRAGQSIHIPASADEDFALACR